MEEGARGGGYARVRLPLIIIPDRTALIDACHTCRLCGDPELRCNVWRRYGASVAGVLAPFVATSSASSHHVRRHSASLLKSRAWVCPRATRCHTLKVTVWIASWRW